MEPVRIAMWSGPRNISTAMMRSFENRPDTAVSDEPFYAAYLARTGLDHPMRDEVLASQPQDWSVVAADLLGAVPGGRAIWYQKHMSHHMLEGFGLDWSLQCRNGFLIRDPAAVLASYTVKRAEVSLAEIGIVQQRELFDRVCDRLATPRPWLRGCRSWQIPGGPCRPCARPSVSTSATPCWPGLRDAGIRMGSGPRPGMMPWSGPRALSHPRRSFSPP